MKEIIYPKKLDVPSTIGTIFDLQDFFCGRGPTGKLARIEMEKYKRLHLN